MQLLCVTPNCCKGSTFCPPKGNNVKKAQNPVPKRHDKVKFLKSLAPPLMAALLTLSPIGYIPDYASRNLPYKKRSKLWLFGESQNPSTNPFTPLPPSTFPSCQTSS
ncbi:hypothetical protein L484_018477 [Morus notabilis]|uniref:Uncharacterized protein n=1 Tax=Morus notabilis TaxID=981085 RepID=W9S3L3_9ROSA|nr:hypothetical protein L484_018477 [Morus notabilis]